MGRKRKRKNSERQPKRQRVCREKQFQLLQLNASEIVHYPCDVLAHIKTLGYASEDQQRKWWEKLFSCKRGKVTFIIMEASIMLTHPQVLQDFHSQIGRQCFEVLQENEHVEAATELLVSLLLECIRAPKLRQSIVRAHLKSSFELFTSSFNTDPAKYGQHLIQLLRNLGATCRPYRETVLKCLMANMRQIPVEMLAHILVLLAFKPVERRMVFLWAIKSHCKSLRTHCPQELVAHIDAEHLEPFDKNQQEAAMWCEALNQISASLFQEELSTQAVFQPSLTRFMHLNLLVMRCIVTCPCPQLKLPVGALFGFVHNVSELQLAQDTFSVQYTSSQVSNQVFLGILRDLFAELSRILSRAVELGQHRLTQSLGVMLRFFETALVFQDLTNDSDLRSCVYDSITVIVDVFRTSACFDFQQIIEEMITLDLSRILKVQKEPKVHKRKKTQSHQENRLDFQDADALKLVNKALRLAKILYDSGGAAVISRMRQRSLETCVLQLMFKYIKEKHPILAVMELPLYQCLVSFVSFSAHTMRIASIPWCMQFFQAGCKSADPEVVLCAFEGIRALHRGDECISIPLPVSDELEMEIERAMEAPEPPLNALEPVLTGAIASETEPAKFQAMESVSDDEPMEPEIRIQPVVVEQKEIKPMRFTENRKRKREDPPEARKRVDAKKDAFFVNTEVKSTMKFGDVDSQDPLQFLQSLGLKLRLTEVDDTNVVPLFHYVTDTY